MPDVATLPAAPEGSHWEWREVSTNHGKDSLGERPLLAWDTLEGAKAKYGEEGLLNSLCGTSLTVSYQAAARRLAAANEGKKTSDEINVLIAEAILKFEPGKRAEPTPGGAAARAAKAVADTAGERGANAITKLLADIKGRMERGELTVEELEAMELG